MGPGALRRADDGAQVVGVLQLVAEDEEGGLAPLLGQLEQVLHRGVLLYGRHGHHPLVVGPAAEVVQLAGVGLFDGGAGRLGLGHQGRKGPRALAPLDV